MDKDRAADAIAAIKEVLDSPVAFTLNERLAKIRAIVEAVDAGGVDPDQAEAESDS